MVSSLVATLGIASLGCGDSAEGSSGAGGSGGAPLAERSTYALSCTIDPLVLEIPIELSYALDHPYFQGVVTNLGFSAAIIFDEVTSTALIEAGIAKIDILSAEVGPWVLGATPPMVRTSLAAAPINDFDLEVDTNENGMAGPHRLELNPVSVPTLANANAEEVELGLVLDGVSMVLGDARVPTDCLGPTLVGSSVRFPVQPAP